MSEDTKKYPSLDDLLKDPFFQENLDSWPIADFVKLSEEFNALSSDREKVRLLLNRTLDCKVYSSPVTKKVNGTVYAVGFPFRDVISLSQLGSMIIDIESSIEYFFNVSNLKKRLLKCTNALHQLDMLRAELRMIKTIIEKGANEKSDERYRYIFSGYSSERKKYSFDVVDIDDPFSTVKVVLNRKRLEFISEGAALCKTVYFIRQMIKEVNETGCIAEKELNDFENIVDPFYLEGSISIEYKNEQQSQKDKDKLRFTTEAPLTQKQVALIYCYNGVHINEDISQILKKYGWTSEKKLTDLYKKFANPRNRTAMEPEGKNSSTEPSENKLKDIRSVIPHLNEGAQKRAEEEAKILELKIGNYIDKRF